LCGNRFSVACCACHPVAFAASFLSGSVWPALGPILRFAGEAFDSFVSELQTRWSLYVKGHLKRIVSSHQDPVLFDEYEVLQNNRVETSRVKASDRVHRSANYRLIAHIKRGV